jgi:hypothetical protein
LNKFRVQLGDKVKDTVSGLEGIAVARSEYLNGCRQIAIEMAAEKGERKTEWVDEQRVAILECEAFKPLPSSAKTGGEMGAHTPPRDGAL